jgi:hypothetical protein
MKAFYWSKAGSWGKEKSSVLLRRTRYDITNFQVFSEFVFLLDSYRVEQYTELKWADKVVEEGKMGYYFKNDWEEIRKILTKMARVPVELRYLLSWAKYQNMLRFIGNLISTVVVLIFGLGIFFAFSRNRVLYTEFANLIILLVPVIIVGLVISFAAPPIIARKIYTRLREYREKNLDQFLQWEGQIKAIVQNLILSASQQAKENKLKEEPDQEMRNNPPNLFEAVDETAKSVFGRLISLLKGGKKPSQSKRANPEFIFDLFNIDYKGIRMVQRPSLLRKHYRVRLL